MKQTIDVNESDLLGHRLDCVRKVLAGDLDPWAKGYWSTVEQALLRAWKRRILALDYGLKTHTNQELSSGYVSH